MPAWTRRVVALALLAWVSFAADVRTLTILHTNDLHARLMPLENHHGGLAYLAAVIRRELARCHDCILLNAGDLAQGTPVSTIFHGLPVFEMSNMLGFDVSTLGNHDFDYGWMQTRKFLDAVRYPIVCSNVVGSQGQLFTKPYVILTVNGLRVAVIGAMTDELKTLQIPKMMEEWHTLPVVETVRKYAAELKSKSDLIVVLAHITPKEENQFLAKATEVPVLVTGHLHSGMTDAAIQDGRILVRVRGNGEELGRLELKVDVKKRAPVSWTWKHILVDSASIAPDPEVASQVKRWEEQVVARVDRPMGVSRRRFEKAEVKGLLEQAMREESGADFAFMNAGGVRDILPKGPLLERNVWNIMPFDNRLVFGKFKGRDLPLEVLGGRSVDPDHEYTLAVTDFTAANQGSAENLRSTGLQFPGDAGLLRDLLIDWFRKKQVIE